jgi:hypothetical protein
MQRDSESALLYRGDGAERKAEMFGWSSPRWCSISRGAHFEDGRDGRGSRNEHPLPTVNVQHCVHERRGTERGGTRISVAGLVRQSRSKNFPGMSAGTFPVVCFANGKRSCQAEREYNCGAGNRDEALRFFCLCAWQLLNDYGFLSRPGHLVHSACLNARSVPLHVKICSSVFRGS